MTTGSPVVVYSAYGGERWLREAQFSACTALALRQGSGDYRIAVYTDQPRYFDRLPVDIHHNTPEQYETWAGPDHFTYRVKFHVLADALGRYTAPCLLLDSDTYFKRNPGPLLAQLRPGTAIMDRCDGLVFRDPRYMEFAQMLRAAFPGLEVLMENGERLVLSQQDTPMWISGVVGVHYADRTLIDQAFRALNAMLPRCHYFIMEQFAFSEVLRQNARVLPASDCIEHYWGSWVDPYFGVSKLHFYKRQIEALLQHFERMPLEQGLDMIRRARIRPYRRPFVYRVWNRLRHPGGQDH
ncbi:MAG: hypothetical protein IT364_10835 [Candidatus Hydrogenedentes bacterium]|nr:hypothetical protein [Candidatus Hydrogenedentota bacterium]